MNRLLIALLAVVALSCSNVDSRQPNVASKDYVPAVLVTPPLDKFEPSPNDTVSDWVGKEMSAGRMTQEDAFNVLSISLPATNMQGAPINHKFFPISVMGDPTTVLVGTSEDDFGHNCAYDLPYSWTIDCDVSSLVNCRIAITVADHASAFYGTWVFTKPCDGEPIGNWTLYGLTVNYTSVLHVF
jgi:hypothetical protein